ncbi:MAG: sulfite exporter TauE/SafE family protein [Betaproteobacteria bacterium]
MIEFGWLLPIAFGVGVLIGAVGIGGVLLIPALVLFARLGIHEAMATALFTFVFTGIAGTWLFQRRGSIDWRITIPVCVGALFFAFAGAWASSVSSPRLLSFILAGLIIFAGVYVLGDRRGAQRAAFRTGSPHQQRLLGAIGAVSGFGSGYTGVGGPVLSVPLMAVFGFPALAAIGASQAIQIIAAVSGSLGNLQFGSIDFEIAAPVTLSEVAGVFFGVRIVHAIPLQAVQGCVAALCIALGLLLAGHALLHA